MFIGFFPIRDIYYTSQAGQLPDLTQDLAANILSASFTIREHTLGCGDNRHSEPCLDLGDIRSAAIETPPRCAKAPHVIDRRSSGINVFQIDDQLFVDAVPVVLLEVINEALFFENLQYALFQLRIGNTRRRMPCLSRIPYPIQQITDGIYHLPSLTNST
jgi:hypothetical protein